MTEIAGLRIEVFRARELVGGLNQVLEACERSISWLRTVNQLALGLVLCIVFFGWRFFLLPALRRPQLVARQNR